MDALSSIQLLNRYCMGMPRDAFTNTNVTWERHDDKYTGKIVVAVLLPLQSTVRDKVFGQPMTNVKLAKRSAAFEACRKLYEAGEFNDHLIPIDSKRQLANVSEVYFRHWKQFEEGSLTFEFAFAELCVVTKVCLLLQSRLSKLERRRTSGTTRSGTRPKRVVAALSPESPVTSTCCA